MKIKLKNSEKQLELLKQMGSTNKLESLAAQEAFAALIRPAIQTVLDKMGSTNIIFDDMSFNEDDMPEIPLDLYFDANVNKVTTWAAGTGGGAPTQEVGGLRVLKLHWTEIESAVSLEKRYVQRNALDTVSKALNRMSQALLRKKEILGWSVLTKATAEASTNGSDHIITSTTQDVFQADDLNRLITLNDDINVAWDGGTPETEYSSGATDLFLSPRMMQEIRAMAYQPMNTRHGIVTTEGASSIALPESVREGIFRSSGLPEFFGLTLHKLNELGVGKAYNNFFAANAGSVAHGGGAYDPADDETIFALNLGRDVLVRPIATNAVHGGTVNVEADDTFMFNRSKKIGWFGGQQLSFVVLDSRVLAAIVV